MDLYNKGPEATPEEIAAIEAVIGPLLPDQDNTVGTAEATRRRPLLLPALHAAQARVGWISPAALAHICRRLHVPPAEAYGVASFYALFSLTPRAPVVAHVCEDVACMAAGSGHLLAQMKARCGEAGAGTERTWQPSPCLGLCESAPAAMLVIAGDQPVELSWGGATADNVVQAMSGGPLPSPAPQTIHQPREDLRLLRRVGAVDPTCVDAWIASGGGAGLRRAIEIGPEATIREVSASGLLGRGGAGFPTGRKWAAVASQPAQPHYLVCNADESEPGTFKDRVLMESDPFTLVEAMIIAGFATGCGRGLLYLRGEYPLATRRMAGAVEAARAIGLLGHDILGSGLSFDIEIHRGAGAYICGEETALLNSLEGYRGEPRTKPPFPVEIGLFGKPTLINNVETLCNVPDILTLGAKGWAGVGTASSAGTRLFCVSGRVAKPGIYELPMGGPLSDLIELAGGLLPGAKLQTVLLGGAAGTFLRPDQLDVPLSFEGTRNIGASLGSGVVMVLDDSVPLLPILRRLAAFFRDESCGQCVPCRVGTVRQEELLSRLARGAPLGSLKQERALLGELGQCMRDASICGLGQTASLAVESAFANLRLTETP